jgi:hypothetical protein
MRIHFGVLLLILHCCVSLHVALMSSESNVGRSSEPWKGSVPWPSFSAMHCMERVCFIYQWQLFSFMKYLHGFNRTTLIIVGQTYLPGIREPPLEWLIALSISFILNFSSRTKCALPWGEAKCKYALAIISWSCIIHIFSLVSGGDFEILSSSSAAISSVCPSICRKLHPHKYL